MRARELGLAIGRLPAGPHDSITDVAGVRVGHTTLIEGDGPLRVGEGPVRTGVTVVVPHDGDVWNEPIFAGAHRLNGNGEMTGLEWVREAGQLGGVIAITNTHSVGLVHHALVDLAASQRRGGGLWSLPVVGETWDGLLNDVDGQHVQPEHVVAALESATGGTIAEGNVGGGTGMTCHEFKGGTGTASRVASVGDQAWTVGVLVQANHGNREDLRIDGVPVGAVLGTDVIPSPDEDPAAEGIEPGAGSVIVLIATDAPLLPHQLTRLAQRGGLGLARTGTTANHSSGDLLLAFATGNRGIPSASVDAEASPTTHTLRFVPDSRLTPIFKAAVEATEAAVVAALLAAETMTGRDRITAHALDHERLLEVMARFGRGPGAGAP